MSKKRKTISMTVTVTVPYWLNAVEARREVRTLINEQCNYLSYKPVRDNDGNVDYNYIDSGSVKCSKVGAA